MSDPPRFVVFSPGLLGFLNEPFLQGSTVERLMGWMVEVLKGVDLRDA